MSAAAKATAYRVHPWIVVPDDDEDDTGIDLVCLGAIGSDDGPEAWRFTLDHARELGRALLEAAGADDVVSTAAVEKLSEALDCDGKSYDELIELARVLRRDLDRAVVLLRALWSKDMDPRLRAQVEELTI